MVQCDQMDGKEEPWRKKKKMWLGECGWTSYLGVEKEEEEVAKCRDWVNVMTRSFIGCRVRLRKKKKKKKWLDEMIG